MAKPKPGIPLKHTGGRRGKDLVGPCIECGLDRDLYPELFRCYWARCTPCHHKMLKLKKRGQYVPPTTQARPPQSTNRGKKVATGPKDTSFTPDYGWASKPLIKRD